MRRSGEPTVISTIERSRMAPLALTANQASPASQARSCRTRSASGIRVPSWKRKYPWRPALLSSGTPGAYRPSEDDGRTTCAAERASGQI